VNGLIDEMSREARAIVAEGAGAEGLTEVRLAYMRYHGQGHEIVVALPNRPLEAGDAETLREAFESEYSRLYGRVVPGQTPEVLSWTLSVTAPKPSGVSVDAAGAGDKAQPVGSRRLFDPASSDFTDAQVYRRADMTTSTSVPGPAAIIEDQTTTIVAAGYTAGVNDLGHLVLTRTS